MSSNHNEYPCDVCGTKSPISIEITKQYTGGQNIMTCSNCGFVYIPTRRSWDEISKCWNDELFHKSYNAKIPYIYARQTYVAQTLATNVETAGKSICDIGAGDGQFLEIYKHTSPQSKLFGIEPSQQNIDIMKNLGIECMLGSIEDYEKSQEFQSKRFDIVTMMWTLEACSNPREMLRIAKQMLSKDGYVVVATGSRLLVPFKKKLSSYLSKNPVDSHPVRFTANSLQNLLEVCGFEVTFVNRYEDGDFLVVIAKNSLKTTQSSIKKDSPQEIIDFFEKWHEHTQWLNSKESANLPEAKHA
jgi:SAM-dependent methyltransferase